MIDLVIVSNGKTEQLRQTTQNCIDSFHETCHGKVIVVEKSWKGYDGVDTMIGQPEIFNYNACLNRGWQFSTSRWVCFANNDTVFKKGWWKMIEHDYDSMSPYNPGWMYHEGLTGVIEGYNVGSILTGWCILAKWETIETIGGFDEGVEFWCSDNIYADQLQFHGLSHALICDCHVSHRASTTLFGSNKLEYLTRGQLDKYNKAKLKYGTPSTTGILRENKES